MRPLQIKLPPTYPPPLFPSPPESPRVVTDDRILPVRLISEQTRINYLLFNFQRSSLSLNQNIDLGGLDKLVSCHLSLFDPAHGLERVPAQKKKKKKKALPVGAQAAREGWETAHAASLLPYLPPTHTPHALFFFPLPAFQGNRWKTHFGGCGISDGARLFVCKYSV